MQVLGWKKSIGPTLNKSRNERVVAGHRVWLHKSCNTEKMGRKSWERGPGHLHSYK